MTAYEFASSNYDATVNSDNSIIKLESEPHDSLISNLNFASESGLKSLSHTEENTKVNLAVLPDLSFYDSSIKLAQNTNLRDDSQSDTTSLFLLAQVTGDRQAGKPGKVGKPETDRLVREKIRQIEKDFPVSITPPREFLGNQENSNSERKPAYDPKAKSAIYSRLPSMKELDALASALEATKESVYTKDGSKLKITFADKAIVRGITEGAQYLSARDNNGRAEIRVLPPGRFNEQLLAHMFRHEIGHNAEYNAYEGGQHPPEVYESLGFKKVPNFARTGKSDEATHFDAVRVKDSTRPDKELLFIRPDPQSRWRRVNEEGKLLDKNGNLVPFANGRPVRGSNVQPQFADDKFIEKNLVVKNPTRYFDNINETVSESYGKWSGLRDAEKAKFEQDFPHHYEAIKKMLDAQKRNLKR